jgi:hypothetical protein
MRTQVGLIALVLLIGAAVRYLTTRDLADMMLGGLMRIGLVMGAIWLAWPQFTAMFAKTPKWLLVALVVSVVVFAIRPQLLWWLPVALIAVWFAWSRVWPMFKPGAAGAAGTTGGKPPRRPKRKVT